MLDKIDRSSVCLTVADIFALLRWWGRGQISSRVFFSQFGTKGPIKNEIKKELERRGPIIRTFLQIYIFVRRETV